MSTLPEPAGSKPGHLNPDRPKEVYGVKLRELNVGDVTPQLIDELVAPVRELAAREKRPLRDAELLELVEKAAATGQS